MENWTTYIPHVIGLIGGIAAWNKDRIATALNIKKQKTDVESSIVDNAKEIVEFYKSSFGDFKEEITRQEKRLRGEMQDLEQSFKIKIDQQKEIIEEQKKFIQKCKRSLDYYSKNCRCIEPQDFEESA